MSSRVKTSEKATSIAIDDWIHYPVLLDFLSYIIEERLPIDAVVRGTHRTEASVETIYLVKSKATLEKIEEYKNNPKKLRRDMSSFFLKVSGSYKPIRLGDIIKNKNWTLLYSEAGSQSAYRENLQISNFVYSLVRTMDVHNKRDLMFKKKFPRPVEMNFCYKDGTVDSFTFDEIEHGGAKGLKADFIFKFGSRSVYKISHKDGRYPGDFRQYAGVTDLMNDPTVRWYMNTLKDHLILNGSDPEALDWRDRSFKNQHVISNIPRRLKSIGMFGKDFDKIRVGEDSTRYDAVNIVIQGDIVVECVSDGVYNVHESQCQAKFFKNKNNGYMSYGKDYEPFLGTIEAKNRKSDGIDNCRTGIYPHKRIVKDSITATELFKLSVKKRKEQESERHKTFMKPKTLQR